MSKETGMLPRRREGGFATAAVIVLLLVSIVGGTYVLKMTRSQAAASGGYYQARSAALAAQAGLEGGIGQLAGDPASGLALLNGYLGDTTRQWLLGDSAGADRRTEVEMDNGLQRYAARIVAFDPASGMVRLEGQGKGPGGSESRAYGVFRLGGVEAVRPVLAHYVWFMAGESRNVDQPVDVWGDAYFGGGVHFNGGADGSVMHGTVKVARGTGLQSSFDADIFFCKNTWFQTPFKAQGLGVKFTGNAGFDGPITLETDATWTESAFAAYVNSGFAGGTGSMHMDLSRVVHSGSLDPARVVNSSGVTDNGGPIDIGAVLGMDPGPESELTVDFSSVPPSFRHTPISLGIAPWGNTDGNALSRAYADAQAAGRLWNGFLFVSIDAPLVFNAGAEGNILRGRFVFDVSARVSLNGNLPVSDPASVSLWHFRTGGRGDGFGGPGRFRGYVNVTGTGTMIYQWPGGCDFQGAIHHVSPTAGFQMNGSTGPLRLTFNSGVFDELSVLGVLVPPSGIPSTGGSRVKLTDVKIRPVQHARYY